MILAISDSALALASALLGAVVGGAMSMLGTIVVGRRELTRGARIRLYDEDIPSLLDKTPNEDRRFPPSFHWKMTSYREQVRRTATIAGWRTRRQAKEVLDALAHADAEQEAEFAEHRRIRDEYKAALEAAGGYGDKVPKPANYDNLPNTRADTAKHAAMKQIHEFSDWLGKRLR